MLWTPAPEIVEVLLSLITSSINPREWQELVLEDYTFHAYLSFISELIFRQTTSIAETCVQNVFPETNHKNSNSQQ